MIRRISRHQRAPAAVDDRGVISRAHNCTDRLNQVALDEDVHVFEELIVCAVEDVDVGQQRLRRGLRFLLLGRGGTAHSKEAEHPGREQVVLQVGI